MLLHFTPLSFIQSGISKPLPFIIQRASSFLSFLLRVVFFITFIWRISTVCEFVPDGFKEPFLLAVLFTI